MPTVNEAGENEPEVTQSGFSLADW